VHTIRELEQSKILLTALNKFLINRVDELTKISDDLKKGHSEKEIEQIKILTSQLYNELSAKRKEVEDLAETLSHEFRAPLIPIKAYTDMLLSDKFGELSERQKEKLSLVKSSIDKMQSMLNDLILAKQLKLEPLKLNKQVVDVMRLVESAISSLQEKAEKKGISISYGPKQEFACYCDPERIIYVLTRIIQNSVDAISTPRGNITIDVIPDDKSFNIIIKDTGVGISKELLGMMFTKYYQVDDSSTREKGGFGLSLYLCKEIIAAHGGKIKIKSVLGKNTEVYIMIPKR